MPQPPQCSRMDIGDAVIPYLHYQEKGPTVVMLHATGFLPWIWHPAIQALGGSLNVVAPYICKHREPNMDNGGVGWGLLARDFVSLFQRLDIRKPYYLVGHSMGGAISTLAAGLLGLEPEAMVLIEPIFLPKPAYSMRITVDQHPLASKSIKRRNHWQSRDEARQYLLSKKFFASWDPQVLELYLQFGIVENGASGLTLACQPEKEAALFLGSSETDPWPFLEKATCPVLVVEGETTENKGFIDYPGVAALFPRGSHHLVERTGHLVPMERPRETARLIRDFFSQTMG